MILHPEKGLKESLNDFREEETPAVCLFHRPKLRAFYNSLSA